MPAASSRAASILRASLARRVEGGRESGSDDNNTSTNNFNNSSISNGGHPSHRRTATHDTVLESYTADGDLVEEGPAGVGFDVRLDDIFAAGGGDADPHGPMHPLGEEGMSLSQHNGMSASGTIGTGTASAPRRATSFLGRLSSGSSNNGSNNSSSKKQLGDHLAAKAASIHDATTTTTAAAVDHLPVDNGTGESFRHGSSFLDRLALITCPTAADSSDRGRRKMRCVMMVAALALVGVVVATGVSSVRGREGGAGQQQTINAHGPGWVGIPEAEDKPTKPTLDAPTTTTTTTTTTTYNKEKTTTSSSYEITWLQDMHLEDPNLRTLGSTVSFSADANSIAISAKQSQTIQVHRRQADGTWNLIDRSLPGTVAILSANGNRVAVADSQESTVITYELHRGQWRVYGTRIVDIWGARGVSLSADGTTLAVSHNADAICRICPSVATVFELSGDESTWIQQDDVLGAYDFDFSIELSWDAQTLMFSGRVYGNVDGKWIIKASFPDFITSHSVLSGNGMSAAVSLPDCHIFKNADPSVTACTNTEKHEVSVLEYANSSTGGWWNRKGLSIGPEMAAHEGTTGIALSEDGNTVAIAVGNRGQGGEGAVHVGDAMGNLLGDAPLDGPVGGALDMASSPLSMDDDETIDELPIDGRNYGHNLRRALRKTDEDRKLDEDNWSDDWDQYINASTAYESDNAFVRVYHYDESTGDWSTVGKDIALDTSGATVSLSADGSVLAVGVPYGGMGSTSSGHVKIYDLVAQ